MIRSMGRIALLLLVGNAAWADQFQIRDKRNGDDFNVPFATVQLEDGTVLGQTDKYGRMTVTTLAEGEYQAQVIQGSETRYVTLIVDGEEGLKVVYLD
jgi:hypothetical protein